MKENDGKSEKLCSLILKSALMNNFRNKELQKKPEKGQAKNALKKKNHGKKNKTNAHFFTRKNGAIDFIYNSLMDDFSYVKLP